MTKEYKLANRLYKITFFAFWFMILFSFIILFFDVFIENGKMEKFESITHHSKGYSIKARLQFNIPDTTIIYNANNRSGRISNSNNKKLNQNFIDIKSDKSLIKSYQVNEISVYNNFKNIDKLINKIEIQDRDSEIDIIVNPKNVVLKLILMSKTYLTLFLILFIVFQFKNLFKTLNQNFIFSKKLNQYIKSIGYSLLVYQLIILVLSILIMQYITRIDFNHFIPSIENSSFYFLSLYTEIDCNLLTIFVGLCLIVLSKLLEYGYEMQDENDKII